jgi:hypothetical protein
MLKMVQISRFCRPAISIALGTLSAIGLFLDIAPYCTQSRKRRLAYGDFLCMHHQGKMPKSGFEAKKYLNLG